MLVAAWLRGAVAGCLLSAGVGVGLPAALDGDSNGAVVGPPVTAGDPPPHAVARSAAPRAARDLPRLRTCQDTYVDKRRFTALRVAAHRLSTVRRGRPGMPATPGCRRWAAEGSKA